MAQGTEQHRCGRRRMIGIRGSRWTALGARGRAAVVLLIALMGGAGVALTPAAAWASDDAEDPPSLLPRATSDDEPGDVEPDVLKGTLPGGEHIMVEGEPTEFQRALTASSRIDEFFADERFEDEVNFTRLRLRGNTYIREGSGVEFDPKTRFRYAFPYLERRFSVLLSGDFDSAVDADEDHPLQSELKSILEPVDDEDAVLAIQALIAATERYNVSFQTGLRFRDFEPEAFFGPRYRQTIDLEPWLMRLTQQVRWFTDRGFDAESVIDFERQFNQRFFLRVTPRADWSEEDDEFSYGLSSRLVQYLGPRHALTYEIALRAETEPVHTLDRIVTRARYRRRLWGEWLYVEVAPELAFLRQRDFDITPGLLIRVDTIIDFRW